jgi:hypothetical protein
MSRLDSTLGALAYGATNSAGRCRASSSIGLGSKQRSRRSPRTVLVAGTRQKKPHRYSIRWYHNDDDDDNNNNNNNDDNNNMNDKQQAGGVFGIE